MGGGKAGGSVTVTLQNNASVSFGSGSLELHDIANAAAVSSLRLNGGTLTAGGFTKAKTSYTNMICFNGGTLKAGASSASFLPVFSVSTNIVQSGGAIIDDGGYAITIAAPLLHDPSLGSTLDGGLTKLGAGTLTLSGVSLYTGPTTIKAGTLALALASASTIANTTNIYIAAGAVLDTTTAGGFSLGSGRTLWGNGSVNGAFTINSGALLAPGSNAIGTLTFNNALTLAAGSTNIFEISHALQTNDLAVVSGALTCGGTLIVTNLSGALAAGDSFKLFNAGSYNGAFANVILPPLNSGLGWNTNALAISGVIAVVSAAPPVISSVNWSATGFGFSGTGGVAGVTFYVLASTNVAAPVTNWTPLLTNQFGTDGSFNFTNDPGTNAQNFYRLQLQ
jgi:autotransporter-associated beta strand protein